MSWEWSAVAGEWLKLTRRHGIIPVCWNLSQKIKIPSTEVQKYGSCCRVWWTVPLMVRLFCHRYLDLTEEEKEKLKGSYKVARKLEKLENLQDRCVLFTETRSWLWIDLHRAEMCHYILIFFERIVHSVGGCCLNSTTVTWGQSGCREIGKEMLNSWQ
jgi:hypothetical protein